MNPTFESKFLAWAVRYYSENGPRLTAEKVVPVAKFAKMTKAQVDKGWDFETRHAMHELAGLIVEAQRGG